MSLNRPDIFKRRNAFPTIADVVMLVVMFFVGSFTLGLVIKSAWTSLSAGLDDATYTRMVRYGSSMFGQEFIVLYCLLSGPRLCHQSPPVLKPPVSEEVLV